MIIIKCKNCNNKYKDYKSNNRKFCSRVCYNTYQSQNPNVSSFKKGHSTSQEIRTKMKDSQTGTKHPDRKNPEPFTEEHLKNMRGRTGEKHWNWQGGKTILQKIIRNSYLYRQWRSDVFTRDGFVCQGCLRIGCYLEAHHIKPFSTIIKEYKIKSFTESLDCSELWNINNGQTLCIKCHNSTKKGVPR